MHLSLLYLPYERGGLNLPDMKLYYWAAILLPHYNGSSMVEDRK